MKCTNCNRGEMRTKDYGFMFRDTCDYCGMTQDTPKAGRQKEYEQWLDAAHKEIDELEK